MQSVKRRVRVKITVVAAAVLLVLLLGASAFFVFRGGRLSRSLEKLDVSDPLTVTQVMKYGGDDPDTVLTVARAYSQARGYSDCVRFCLYALQYLDGGAEFTELLTDAYAHLGAGGSFLSQFENADFTAGDFAVTSRFEDFGYGGDDGVYVSFCGGLACAKISSMIPLSLAAAPDGVYVLDAADSRLKLLSADGLSLTPVTDGAVSEFILTDGGLYYIDGDGTPFTPSGEHTLPDGERAAELSEWNGAAVCTVVDSDYNRLYEIRL